MTDGTLVHSNRASLELAGVKLADVVGLPFDQTPWWRDTPKEEQRWIREAITGAAAGQSSRYEAHIQTREGGTRAIDFSLQPVFDVQGRVAFLVISGIDISDRLFAERQASYLADHDPLTELPNRRWLSQRLAINRERARAERRPFAALCINLDRFAHVNTLHGHEAGDAVLRMVRTRICACLDRQDRLVRSGGDEFVVLLGPHGSSEEVAVRAAVAVLDAVRAPMVIGERDVIVTVSIGVAKVDPEASDGELLLRRTGIALGRAKTMGGNAYFVYTPEICGSDREHLALAADLHHALPRDELRLVYQPQVDLVSGEIVGVEALLRWTHAAHGPVSPDRFIPIAEETGLIGPIGDWVIRTACTTAARWQAAGLPPVRMSINVSAAQLRQRGFAERVLRMLEHARLEPQRFGIEMTESLAMERFDEASAQLRRLRAAGVEVSLDDFGTGYSSLSCLRRLPIDVVKLDRSLVPALTAGSEALSIARAIIAIAHSFGMKTLAEGVENEGQLEWLVASRCDRIQGYHFSRPGSAAEIEAMLRSGRRLVLSERRRAARIRSVLVVDDDPSVRDRIVQKLLWRFGESVRVDACAGARDALARILETPYDIVASGLRMPETDGIALLRRVRELQPHAVRMMLVEPSDLARVLNDERQVDVFRYLAKPWSGAMLQHFQAAFEEVDRRRAQLSIADPALSSSPGLSEAELELRDIERQEFGITAAPRAPLGEVELPTQLMTLPGDLWVPKQEPDKRDG